VLGILGRTQALSARPELVSDGEFYGRRFAHGVASSRAAGRLRAFHRFSLGGFGACPHDQAHDRGVPGGRHVNLVHHRCHQREPSAAIRQRVGLEEVGRERAPVAHLER